MGPKNPHNGLAPLASEAQAPGFLGPGTVALSIVILSAAHPAALQL
jgi:hypothetical protein